VVAVAALAVTTACGGTDTPPSTTPITMTTTSTTPTTVAITDAGRAVGATFATSLGTALGIAFTMPDTESACTGSSLVAALGEEAARKVAAADPVTLIGSKDVAIAALDACVAGATLAGPVTMSFYKGLGAATPTDAVINCVAGQFGTKVGTVAFLTMAANTSGSMPKELIATFDECVPPDEVADLLAAQFEAAGAEPEVAKCVARELEGKVTLSDLAEISGDNGNIPVDMQAVIDDARLACDATG